jgi:Predicted membrane protein
MNLFDYFVQAVTTKYLDFSGRARRKEYWGFILFDFIINVAIGFVSHRLRGSILIGSLSPFYSLAVLLPRLAVAVRRLHDNDKSGWWFFIFLVPIIGPIWLFILLIREGTPGANRFGPDPKAGAMD